MVTECTLETVKKFPFELQPFFTRLIHFNSALVVRHIEKCQILLKHVLPQEFFELGSNEAKKWLKERLPLVRWNELTETPGSLSIFFLCSANQEAPAEKVLLDLIRKWLIPEREIYILGFQNVYFYWKEISTELFFAAEVEVLIEKGAELATVENNLPILAEELTLCLNSIKYLEQTLDTKALSLDQKSAQIQRYLRKLIQKDPQNFDESVFMEMSTFLALSQPEFRKIRLSKHLARLIVSHYLMRKKLVHQLAMSPEKRHLELRFIVPRLYFPFGSKSVLGLVITVSLKDRYEIFEDIHVLAAVERFVPTAQVVKGSHYFYRVNHESTKYLYVELEKKEGSAFTREEIRLLKKELKEELKKRIERLIPSVFMIRNEEEVMRSILLLSQELKKRSDLAQVMINFDQLGAYELCFTILVVRALKKQDIALEKAFEKVKQPFRLKTDRVQNVGYIRKKIPKEANVFHLYLPKERSLLRADSSVNFYSAREKVMAIITEALGEVRDYNGGMILKQGELFTRFKEAFRSVASKGEELLENFFFGLSPIEAQATLPLSSLESLFHLVLEAVDAELPKRESYFLKFKQYGNLTFAAFRTKDRSIEPLLQESLSQLENFSKVLIKTQVNLQGTLLQAFIYEPSLASNSKLFQSLIDSAIRQWLEKRRAQQELFLSFLDLPPSLDPRLGGDELSSTVIRMLFEGLTRISTDNKTSLALAESIDISRDLKRYVFKLRPSFWSDHTPVTAYDFEYAWKKILFPSFDFTFAYFFYPIKNAKAAKEGKVDLSEVGIKAVSENILEIELENPTPEFLELTAHALYSPINHTLDQLHPNWAQSGEEIYVSNGPFKLKKIDPMHAIELIKNDTYWDKEAVKLDRISISKNNSEVAYTMFNNDEIDWIGRPFRVWENYFFANIKEEIFSKPLGTLWCVFNTQQFPFNNVKLRKAFSYAMNREEICSKLNQGFTSAYTPLPLVHSQVDVPKGSFDRRIQALQLFEEALEEMEISKKDFPIITLIFGDGKVRHETALLIQRQVQETLGIIFHIEAYDFNLLFLKITKGDFQIGTIAWKAWINHPIYTLNSFKYLTNRVNFSKWQTPEYQHLLDRASKEINPIKQKQYFKKAEEILIEEQPVAAVYHELYKYTHKKHLKGTLCSETGNFDFKWASIVR